METPRKFTIAKLSIHKLRCSSVLIIMNIVLALLIALLIIKFSFLACASIKTNLNVLNLKFLTTILEIVTVFYKI